MLWRELVLLRFALSPLSDRFLRVVTEGRQSFAGQNLKPDACSLKPTKRADDGLRTRDLQLGKLALYQLSYVRMRGYFSMRDLALSPL